MRVILVSLLVSLSLMACAEGGERLAWLAGDNSDDPIKGAEMAGPAKLASNATITDLEGNVLREGTNGWTCIPDDATTSGISPWCYNDAWAKFRAAMAAGEAPNTESFGIAYMLKGDAPVSNIDPMATEPTADNIWVADSGPHLMLIAPGDDPWAGYSDDPFHGGPWIMWPGTPYEHLMVPLEEVK